MLKFDLKTGGKYKGCMLVCTYRPIFEDVRNPRILHGI